VALVALAAALLLLAWILVVRLRGRRRAERIARQEETWRRAMHEAMERPVEERLPPIADGDLPEFLMLWNRLQETQRGPAAENMSQLLRDNGLDKRAMALLRSGSVRSRLIAMSTLGFVGAEDILADLHYLECTLRDLGRAPAPGAGVQAAAAVLAR